MVSFDPTVPYDTGHRGRTTRTVVRIGGRRVGPIIGEEVLPTGRMLYTVLLDGTGEAGTAATQDEAKAMMGWLAPPADAS
jgi:hypothetical protein